MHLHISGGFLFTVRRQRRAPSSTRCTTTLGPEGAEAEEYIVYRVLDALTDALFPVVDAPRDADRRARGARAARHRPAPARRRSTGSSRRSSSCSAGSCRSATSSARRPTRSSTLPGLTRGSREYLRDIGDHLAQVTGELYRQTDDLGALTSTYFNANANRLNRLATRLTVLATFFLIWTLVTSFFGQNFGWLIDHIDSLEAFLIYEALGLVLPTVDRGGLLLAEAARMAVTPRPERLAPETFRLPVERIRDGYYSDAYFNYTKELLEHEGRDPRVTMQVFQRKESILGGIDEAVAVLKQCTGRRLPDGGWETGWDALDVRALREGDAIAPWETVMTIEGPYALFAHLETVYLGRSRGAR